MMPTLSIIVPTTGRISLLRAVYAALPSLGENDEILVVGDGPQPFAEQMIREVNDARVDYLDGPQTGCFGNAQRQAGMQMARGSHLVFVDDDDLPLVGYAAIWRVLCARHPHHVVLARMQDKFGNVLWDDQAIRQGNISTQMSAVPNVPARLGQWGTRYEGDFDFIQSTLAVGHWPIAWSPTILVDCRPFEQEPAA